MVRGGCGSDYVKLDDEMCTLAAHSLFNSMMMKAALEGVHSLSEPEPGEDPSEIHEVADDVLRLIEMEWEVA